MLEWLNSMPDWIKFALVLVVFYVGNYVLQMMNFNRVKKQVIHLQETLKIGDTVLTQSGLYGTITSMSKTVAMLQISPNMEIVIDRFSIKEVVEKPVLEARKEEK